MESATSRPIAPLDSIWLSMDRPNNLMVIVSVILLGGVPDWDEVTEMVRHRVVDQYPVFRQRPEPPALPGGRPPDPRRTGVTLAAPVSPTPPG